MIGTSTKAYIQIAALGSQWMIVIKRQGEVVLLDKITPKYNPLYEGGRCSVNARDYLVGIRRP